MKLLVTTDFSVNSKGAIRFAQTLAKQAENVEVVFYHAIHIMKPTRWNDAFFKRYKEEEIERLSVNLKKFVYTLIGKDKEKFTAIKFVVDNCISKTKFILLYLHLTSGRFHSLILGFLPLQFLSIITSETPKLFSLLNSREFAIKFLRKIWLCPSF